MNRPPSPLTLLLSRHTRRRDLLLALALTPAPLCAAAQQPPVRVGVLGSADWPPMVGLRQGLRGLGFVEGESLKFEYRWSEGQDARLPALAAELVDLKVNAIVPWGTPATLAAKRATATIPIVFVAVGDPVGIGVVSNLARPGENITGFSSLTVELEAKRLELLKQLLPSVSRIGVLANPTNNAVAMAMARIPAAASALGVRLDFFEVRQKADLTSALQALRQARPDAAMVFGDPVMATSMTPVIKFMAEHRLPAMYPWRIWADAGGLIAYAPDYYDMFRRAAGYLGRILSGTKPGELPVQLPALFEFAVNLKTAKELGIEVPAALVARATDVIE